MIALIGTLTRLLEKLKADKRLCCHREWAEVHSLTALLMDNSVICWLVIQAEDPLPWSDGHILAAAMLLQSKGRLILVGAGATVERLKGSPLVTVAKTEDAAYEILSRPQGGAAKKQSGSSGGGIRGNETEAERIMEFTPKPLPLPASKILLLDVAGAQPRIGCTTQAIALWHYARALGADPAVVMAEEQLRQLSSTMRVQKELSGGCVIEGVPFVTDSQRSYDCYIRDLGYAQAVPGDADAAVLVAGVKPWELAYTMRAIRALRGFPRKMAVLSFAEAADARKLRVLFQAGQIPVITAPYAPDPWTVTAQTLFIYDTLLRPILERQIEEDKTKCFDEPQRT